MRPRPSVLRRLKVLVPALGAIVLGGCFHLFFNNEFRRVAPPDDARADTIASSVKVHLIDGSTVIFPKGAVVTHDAIAGAGTQYSLLSDTIGVDRARVSLDSVIGVEAFAGTFDALTSLVASVAATGLTVLVVMAAAVAIFGSCPTLYASVAGGALQLEAEGFSYAVSPLMEHRDVDGLRARPGPDGIIQLELRNEALETHYINHLEVLAVATPAGMRVAPDAAGRPVALGDFGRVARATDRAGRDVSEAVAAPDGVLFSTDPSTIASAREGDLDDWIDLEVAGLPPGDSVAVLLRMRNSLLNTVLLYEGMLGGRDAIDWLDRDLKRISTAVDLSRWYVRTMGLRATTEGAPLEIDGPFEGHARVGDVGPIAFRDVALVLPRAVRNAATARIRLRFVADNWRIDEVRVAGVILRPAVTILPVDSIVVEIPATGTGPMLDTAAVRALAAADESYLETRPGQRMQLFLHPDPSAHRDETTYFVAWQGWYREWIRGNWLAKPFRTTPFVPGDAALMTALHSWIAQKSEFERAFYSSKIPVR